MPDQFAPVGDPNEILAAMGLAPSQPGVVRRGLPKPIPAQAQTQQPLPVRPPVQMAPPAKTVWDAVSQLLFNPQPDPQQAMLKRMGQDLPQMDGAIAGMKANNARLAQQMAVPLPSAAPPVSPLEYEAMTGNQMPTGSPQDLFGPIKAKPIVGAPSPQQFMAKHNVNTPTRPNPNMGDVQGDLTRPSQPPQMPGLQPPGSQMASNQPLMFSPPGAPPPPAATPQSNFGLKIQNKSDEILRALGSETPYADPGQPLKGPGRPFPTARMR